MLLDRVANTLPASALRLEVPRSSRWSWQKTADVVAAVSEQGGCACSLLAEDADWNEETWRMRPEVLPLLTQTIAAVAEAGVDEFSLEALWAGEEPQVEQAVSLTELLSITGRGRLGTRTRYRVRRELAFAGADS